LEIKDISEFLWENWRIKIKAIIKIQVGYRLIKIFRGSEENDSSYTVIRIWAKLFRCAGQLLANTVHTNTAQELDTFSFYFPLHVSAIHIDHHKVEYRYRKKDSSVTLSFLCLYSTC
jgi:hypothetical protein